MRSTARKLHRRPAKKFLSNGKKAFRRIYTRPVNDLKVKSEKLKYDVARYTAKKPLKTLGMVTAVSIFSGFVLGYMAGKK